MFTSLVNQAVSEVFCWGVGLWDDVDKGFKFPTLCLQMTLQDFVRIFDIK